MINFNLLQDRDKDEDGTNGVWDVAEYLMFCMPIMKNSTKYIYENLQEFKEAVIAQNNLSIALERFFKEYEIDAWEVNELGYTITFNNGQNKSENYYNADLKGLTKIEELYSVIEKTFLSDAEKV